MIKIKNYFRPVGKQYEEDLREIFTLIIKNKNLKNLDHSIYLHRRSKLFMIEYVKFKSYMDNGATFYDAWSKSFSDPIMAYIVQYGDIQCLIYYVKKKVKFWDCFFQKNSYSLILLLITIIFYKISNSLFNYSNINFLIYFILINFFILIFNYILSIIFIFYMYKDYCTKYLFIKYFEQKISLDELLKLKNNFNIDSIISKIKKNKLYKQELLWEKLQFYWKIILVIPIVISFIITALCMAFFLIIIWQILYISIKEVEILT